MKILIFARVGEVVLSYTNVTWRRHVPILSLKNFFAPIVKQLIIIISTKPIILSLLHMLQMLDRDGERLLVSMTV